MDDIGRYRILGELGSGGRRVVYRANDPVLGRNVAIKTLRLIDLADRLRKPDARALTSGFRCAAGSLP